MSELVSYARSELEQAGLFDDDSDYGGQIGRAVMELVEKFSDQGHSGFSASMCIHILKKVLSYKPLTPLTGEDDEWIEFADGLYQNRRCSSIFKDSEGAYQVDYYVFESPSGATFTSSESTKRIGAFPYIPQEQVVIRVKDDCTSDDLKRAVEEYESGRIS